MTGEQTDKFVVIGLDLSITGTGMVGGYPISLGLPSARHFPYNPEISCLVGSKPSNKKIRLFDLLDRVELIRRKVEQAVTDIREASGIPVVFLEGYAMGVRGSRVFDLGELGGIIKKYLYDNKIQFYTVAPTQLKKFILGKGVGGKSDMRMATFKRYSVDFTNDNLCDAYGLAVLGCSFLGANPEEKLTKPQRDVLAKLKKEQGNG